MIPDIKLENYTYVLPEKRIASFPLEERDQSKLLFYNKREISHHRFREVHSLLPDRSLLVFNETKVIPARLIFIKETGAHIEVMLLHPLTPSRDISVTMGSRGEVSWECLVKNLKKWKEEQIISQKFFHKGEWHHLRAQLIHKERMEVKISWANDDLTFAEVLELSGKVPLPPYIKRDPVPMDKPRYQTVYSRNQGAVAAPTAGLHFTDSTLDKIKQAGHKMDFITLHVGAGTFQPIKAKDIRNHDMHQESIVITKENIENLIHNLGNIIVVGTTTMRTLESLYWYGVKLMLEGETSFFIEKLYPYNKDNADLPGVFASLQAVLDHMDKTGMNQLHGETRIFILPGYQFKLCRGLITNYHLPGSTLMLLVGAFVGEDWKKIYDSALNNDYRFLSYGDSSLLLPADIK